jgi:hypothetical protein
MSNVFAEMVVFVRFVSSLSSAPGYGGFDSVNPSEIISS